MAALDTSRTDKTDMFGKVTASLSMLGDSFSNWNSRRATRRALARLSDHELADIGLTRGDIDML